MSRPAVGQVQQSVPRSVFHAFDGAHQSWRRTAIAVAIASAAGTAGAQTVLLDAAGSATVPAGVYWVDVEIASGGGGGGGYDEGAKAGDGGAGVRVTARVAVVPGQSISAVVGQGGTGGLAKQTNAGGGAGGPGAGAGGNGGNANQTNNSGAGGGGGGASAVTIGSSVIRAGGGGGGGGGSWEIIGNPGAPAALSVVDSPVCATPEAGAPGFGSLPGDGAGGGGGGGGYAGAAGTGGVAAVENARGDGVPAGGGGAGGSCHSMTGSNVLSAPPSAAAGPVGGVGASTNQAGASGAIGSVRVVTNPSPPLNAVMAAVFNVPPTLAPAQTVRATLTCESNGPGAAVDATCTPSVTAGGATIGNLVCNPTTPVSALNPGDSITCSFDLTAPATPAAIALRGDAASGSSAGALTNATVQMATAGAGAGVQAVPTLQVWALALLGALMAGVAGWRKRNH